MIPGIELTQFIQTAGLIGVALIVFAETGLLIGFFLPGDSLLFTTGYLVHAGLLPFDIHLTVLLLWAAAVLGDTCGYEIGRHFGVRLYERDDSRLFKQAHLDRARAFYHRHGGKTIVIGRFVPIVRTFVPTVAGVTRMRYLHFLGYNIVGALLWATGITYAGYYLGAWFSSMGLEIDQVLLPIIVVILLASVAPAVIGVLRTKESRQAFRDGVRSTWNSVFHRRSDEGTR